MTEARKWDVCSPRPKKDGGTWWHRVGRAIEGTKGINIYFDSIPLPDKDGRVAVSLFEPKPKDDAAKPAAQQSRSVKEEMDDEIPF